MLIFYLLAALVLLQSGLSLRGGVRYLAYVRREMNAKRPFFMPFASVIVPCRGLDQGLRVNVEALFAQHYPTYELIFVADGADDPALAIVETVRRDFAEASIPRVRVVIAGQAHDSGQKVHNLRAAVREIDPASEVLVFVDTDARPRADWLRSLVAPLADENVGATTGYRWFISITGGFASHLRSVWNASIASALGANGASNFCWGGSTAVMRATFERLDVAGQWRGTVSDDFTLTRTLQRAKLAIYFVPNCLTATYEDCTFAQLVEFSTRQMKITRVYAPHLWKIVLVSNLLFVLVFFGGVALVAARATLGLSVEMLLALVLWIYTLGMWKAYLRLRAVALPLASARASLNRSLLPHLFLWPLTAVLYLYNAVAAGFSRRITWRGITYELKSPNETMIVSDAAGGDSSGPAVELNSHGRAAQP
ncbi:MAG: glycosyltransferase family 2 protein [Pyrinomonadaceae bacterium]|nr:glycosyltransferase family 2 protein [Pyrinomonadaceae bacterium]